jgi:copper homeostasis protein
VPLLEVITCSVTDAVEAEKGGAGRLEIVRELDKGGLTPSLELVMSIIAATRLPVRVMLRKSEGYGVTGEDEVERLCGFASQLSKLSVNGVVLGFVREGAVDLNLTARILSCVPDLKATFHHALEETRNPVEAIREIKKIRQIDRILAHGGDGDWTQKSARLADYQQVAEPEITILAGGGLDVRAVELLSETTRLHEFHIGRAARVPARSDGMVRAERVSDFVRVMDRRSVINRGKGESQP